MEQTIQRAEQTRACLIRHYQTYPKLDVEDVLKYLFQSAFGCEHLVSDESRALDYIRREYAALPKVTSPQPEPLDGAYSRVYLSCLDHGLKPETLAKLFCLSAKKEPDGVALLEEKLRVAESLVADGTLPLCAESFRKTIAAWRDMGYPAIHHSDRFRAEYRPAYRVVTNRFAEFLPLFIKIDQLASQGPLVVAIEGGSAAGKTTLAAMLEQVYACRVFHMDDFFLRPEQRTPSRLAEPGGNVDRERFTEEILQPLKERRAVCFRRFDCQTQTLGGAQTVPFRDLTVVEGAYALHPSFSRYCQLAVFLDIDPECQRSRILRRNTPAFAARFFGEWIPMEQRYFSEMGAKERSDLVFAVGESFVRLQSENS